MKSVIISHATEEGRLYIKEKEFFDIPKVRQMIKKSMESNIYLMIKNKKP